MRWWFQVAQMYTMYLLFHLKIYSPSINRKGLKNSSRISLRIRLWVEKSLKMTLWKMFCVFSPLLFVVLLLIQKSYVVFHWFFSSSEFINWRSTFSKCTCTSTISLHFLPFFQDLPAFNFFIRFFYSAQINPDKWNIGVIWLKRS